MVTTRWTEAPPRSGFWSFVVAVFILQVLAFADRFGLALLAASVQRDLSLSDAQLGVLLGTAFIVPLVLATAVFGRLADRRSCRELLIVGFALWTLATAASAFVANPEALFAARLVLALGEAAVAPVALAVIAERAPASRLASATAVFAAAGPLGKGLALVGGGFALDALSSRLPSYAAPWRELSAMAAVLNLAMAPVIWTLLRSAKLPLTTARPRPHKHRPKLKGAQIAALGLFGVAGCMTVLVSQTLGSWAPAHFHRTFGLSVGESGVLAGAPLMLASPLGGLAAGVVMDRVRLTGGGMPAHAVLAAALLAAGVAAAVFLSPLVPRVDAVAALYALALALGAATAAFLSGMQRRQPEHRRGEFAAWVVAGPNLVGFGVGPALTGWLSQEGGGSAEALRVGLLQVLVAGCVLGAAVALVSGFVRALRRDEGDLTARDVAPHQPSRSETLT